MRRWLRYMMLASSIGIGVGTLWYAGLLHVKQAPTTKKEIAVLIANSPLTVELYQEIVKAVAQTPYADQIELRPYEVSNMQDKILATGIAQKLLEDDPDAVIVAGQALSQIVVQQARKKDFGKPIVFAAVRSPVELGIIDSLERPGGTVTGVISVYTDCGFWALYTAALLRAMKPNVKRILVPIDLAASGGKVSEEIAHTIKDDMARYGIEVDVLGLSSGQDVMRAIEMHMSGHDVLLILTVNALNQYFSGFAKLCREHGTLLFSEQLAAIEHGAGMVYGDSPGHIARDMFAMVVDLVFHKADPATMAVRALLPEQRLIINIDAARRQGYDPDLALLQENLAADPQFAWFKDGIEVVHDA